MKALNNLNHTSSGLTLIELVVCLAIVAILASRAAPWLGRELAQNRLNTQAMQMRQDLMFARAEALRRQRDLVFCPLLDAAQLAQQNSTQPALLNSTQPLLQCRAFDGRGQGHWPNGYLLFVRQADARANHWPDHERGDEIILIRPLAANLDLRFNQGHRLRVSPRSTLINSSFSLTSHTSGVQGWRLVLIGNGRPRMEPITAANS